MAADSSKSLEDSAKANVEKIGALVRAARKAAGVGQDEAASWAGVSGGTIWNWENARTPEAIRLVAYLRQLGATSELCREFVLQILGLETGDTSKVDRELERKLNLVRAVHGHESRMARAAWDVL